MGRSTTTNATRRAARRVLRTVLVCGAISLLAACGGDGLSEAEQKAFVLEYRSAGLAAETAAAAAHPNDEKERAKRFRTDLAQIRQGLLAKYGLGEEEAKRIFVHARRVGWW